MIVTIDDLIKDLELLKMKHGNLFVRVQTQVGHILDIKTKIEKFSNESKTVELEVLIIKGFRE